MANTALLKVTTTPTMMLESDGEVTAKTLTLSNISDTSSSVNVEFRRGGVSYSVLSSHGVPGKKTVSVFLSKDLNFYLESGDSLWISSDYNDKIEALVAYEGPGLFKTQITGFSLDVGDNYHVVISQFFDTNYNVYSFDSSETFSVPSDCDYLIYSNPSEENRNFSLFSNEYENLSIQYRVSNESPEINDYLIFDIRVVNFNDHKLENIHLNFKENFDLGFQGEIDTIILQDQGVYKNCGSKIYPENWVCCPSGEGRQELSQCSEPTSIKFDVPAKSQYSIIVAFNVTNPPSESFITGEPEFSQMYVNPGQVIDGELETLAAPKSKKGVIVGKQGDKKFCDIDCDPIKQAAREFDKPCANGGQPVFIIDIKPATPKTGGWFGADPREKGEYVTEGGVPIFRISNKNAGSKFIDVIRRFAGANGGGGFANDPCKIIQRNLGGSGFGVGETPGIMQIAGDPGSEMSIRVECEKDGNSTVVYPAKQTMRIMDADDSEPVSNCECEGGNLNPWGFDPDCNGSSSSEGSSSSSEDNSSSSTGNSSSSTGNSSSSTGNSSSSTGNSSSSTGPTGNSSSSTGNSSSSSGVYSITVHECGDITHAFPCSSDTVILDCAEENNVYLPYETRAGADLTAVGLLMSGQVDQSNQSILDEEQIAAGLFMYDVAYPMSDVEFTICNVFGV